MSDVDILQRFIFQGKEIRGELVRLKESYQASIQRIEYPVQFQKILGEALCAATLLSATIKFSGKISLQIQGDGPMNLLLVQATHDQKIRGMLKWKERPTSSQFNDLIGNAQFAITIDPEKGNRYQGVVPIGGVRLSHCLENYFDLSEQLSTRIWLSADENTAAGLFLQQLPGKEGQELKTDWEHITILAASITDDELLNLPNETLLYRLFHGEEVRLFEAQSVKFKCVCSREKCEAVIIGLGREEIRRIIKEQNYVDMNCEFCGNTHHFEKKDLERLAAKATNPT